MSSEPVFTEFCAAIDTPGDSLSLPFEARQKARQRVQLASGRVVGVKLPRGSVLRDGDCLRSACGLVVVVNATPESVSTVHSDSPRLLARAAYHLGNRHVWVEIGEGWIRYLHDHVLDRMLEHFGLRALAELAPFEPEAGAYTHQDSAGHAHSHDHNHGHG